MVQMNAPVILRVKFFKVGKLQYISHLDLVRTMYKIIVRSGLPMKYTEGFNPKPKMSFASSISVGNESLCEYMDLHLTESVSPVAAMERLNNEMTDEMQVTECYYPTTKFDAIRWFSYTYRIKTGGASHALAQKISSALTCGDIEITKKTKSGEEKRVNIRPLIRSADVSFEDGRIVIRAVLSASQSAFLAPEHIVKYLRSACGILSDPCIINESYSVLRDGAYTEDMSPFR